MRIRKIKKQSWIMAAVLFWLLAGICVRAEGITGSVTLQLPAQGNGVGVTLYKIADYQADGTFAFLPPFAGSGIVLTDLDAQQAQQAAEHFWMTVQQEGLSGQEQKAADGVLSFTGLEPGYYLLVQTSGEMQLEIQKMLAPIPSMADGNVLVYDAVLAPKYEVPEGAAILDKADDDGGSVAGAKFDLQRKAYTLESAIMTVAMETGLDAGGRFIWEDYRTGLVTDEHGQIVMDNLPLGLYRLVETEAPAGYFLNTAPAYFEVKTGGTVKLDGRVYVPDRGTVEQVTVVDGQTRVEVNKVDEKGKPLGDAHMAVKDGEGKPILNSEGHPKFAFTTSADGAYTLKQLPPGDYYLSELVSPEGYLPAQDVPFTVSPDPEAQNSVTMVDEEEKETVEVLRVTKHLHDLFDDTVTASEGTFYVALFSDEERTQRVSDVKELHFVGSSSQTAEFLNLEPGKPYYVGETDEFGDLLEGAELGGATYIAEYPDGYEVTLTDRDPEGELDFYNLFYDIPEGFYISGEMTVTKQVLRGGEEYAGDGVYYAGIFRDPEFTDLVGEVLEIPMAGESVASVTRTDLFMGEDGSGATYYVTETDEYGNPLDAEALEEFTFTVENGEVTLDKEEHAAEVVIVNDYYEEEVEVSSEEETQAETSVENPPGPSSPSSPTSPGTPTGTEDRPVQTGDGTPIGLYMALLAMALLALAAGVRKKIMGRK